MGWYVYIIQTRANRLYTGITTDLNKRWHAHTTGKGGAKFFRGDKPHALLHAEFAIDRSSATRREMAIKRLTRRQKQLLIQLQGPLYVNQGSRASCERG